MASSPPILDLETVRGSARNACLADRFGPVIVLQEHHIGLLDPRDLGTEPCVVIGADLTVDSAEECELVVSNINRRPITAAATCVLLRATSTMPSTDSRFALESATYSMLQSGPEFAQWQQSRPSPANNDGAEGDAPRVRAVRSSNHLDLTLTRATHGNAVDRQLRDELCETLTLALVDDTIASLSLSGEGRHFCTGGDLDEFDTFDSPANAHLVRLQRSPARMLAAVAARGIAVQAHLHGNCAGSGVELAAFATHVRANHATTLRLPELDLGLVPGAGGTLSIVDRIGIGRTAWLLLTGKAITAQTALQWGLIDEVSELEP